MEYTCPRTNRGQGRKADVRGTKQMFRLKGFADKNELSRTGITVKDRTQMSQTLSITKG